MKKLHSRVALIAAGILAAGALAMPTYALATNITTSATSSTSTTDANKDSNTGDAGKPQRPGKIDFSSDENLSEVGENFRMTRDLYTAIAEHYEESTLFERFDKNGGPGRGGGGPERSDAPQGEQRPEGGPDGGGAPDEQHTPGTYENADVQKRYDELLKRAKTSLDEAYKVAIEAEEYNIAAVDKALESTDSAETKEALEHLRGAAEKHLDRFTRAANGETVEDERPQDGKRGKGEKRQQEDTSQDSTTEQPSTERSS